MQQFEPAFSVAVLDLLGEEASRAEVRKLDEAREPTQIRIVDQRDTRVSRHQGDLVDVEFGVADLVEDPALIVVVMTRESLPGKHAITAAHPLVPVDGVGDIEIDVEVILQKRQ